MISFPNFPFSKLIRDTLFHVIGQDILATNRKWAIRAPLEGIEMPEGIYQRLYEARQKKNAPALLEQIAPASEDERVQKILARLFADVGSAPLVKIGVATHHATRPANEVLWAACLEAQHRSPENARAVSLDFDYIRTITDNIAPQELGWLSPDLRCLYLKGPHGDALVMSLTY